MKSFKIAVVFLCLLFSACTRVTPLPTPAPTIGATFQPTRTPLPSPTPLPTSTPLPSPTPIPPKLPVVMALEKEPETLHPFYAISRDAQEVSAAWQLGCYSQNSFPPNPELFYEAALLPMGCEPLDPPRMEGVPGSENAHFVLRFRIRKDWFWTDGTPVSAQDAIFAWKFIMNPDAQLRDTLTQKVHRMAVVDEKTVDVHFMSALQARQAADGKLRGEVPFEYFSQLNDYEPYAKQSEPLWDAQAALVLRWLPAHTMKTIPARDHLKPKVILPALRGDGSFALGAWNTGQEIILSRLNHEPGATDSIIFKFGRALPAEMVQAKTAHIGMPDHVLTGPYPLVPAPGLHYFVFNTLDDKLQDSRLREAIALSVNTIEIASLLNLTQTWPATFTQSTVTGTRLLKDLGWTCSPSCARFVPAVRGIRNAYTDTLQFTITVAAEDVTGRAIATHMQANLRRAGLAIGIQNIPEQTLFASAKDDGTLVSRNFDLYVARVNLPLRGADTPESRFGCFGSPLRGTTANYSGACPTIRAGENVWQKAAQQFIIVNVGQPQLRVPAQGLTGIRYGGYGPLTWNATVWKN